MKMKTLLIVFIVFAFVINADAQISFDTVETTNVGTGMVYKRVIAPAVPWSINILEVDLKDSSNILETVKANDKLEGQEKVSSMAQRHSYDGHTVVGAVNGDFFNIGPGTPTNVQVSKGEIIRNPISRPAVGFDINNSPLINVLNYSGEVFAKDSSISITNVNTARSANALILYNHFFGSSTGTNNFGSEVSIKAIDPWLVNDTVRCIVINKEDGVGNMSITDTTAVLSGHGLSKVFLDNNVSIGDTIKIINNLMPGLSKLKEVIGGNPKIVINGTNNGDNVSREPRTSIGFSQDSSKLFIFTVDGRQNGFSVGMTFSELADFMINNGVYTGLNLDGGGSTTMVLRDSVVNKPSGGGIQRDVANGLLVISKAPKGNLHSVQISPDYFKLFYGETVQFKLQGFDQNYNPVSISNIQFSLSHNFGSINSSGLFTAGNVVDTGYVYAESNGYKDSALIIIKGITKINILPKDVVTDTFRTQEYNMSAFDSENIPRNLELTDYTWSLSDSSVGTIDSAGNFKGKSAGTTNIIASYKKLSDTASITVTVNNGEQLIDSMEDLSNWIFEKENLDDSTSLTVSNDQFLQGSGSFKLFYKFTYNSSKLNFAYLNTNIPLAGVPDSIYLNVKSDGKQHLVYFIVSDDNDELFHVTIKQYATVADHFDTLAASLNDITPLVSSSRFNFPITLKQIVIKLASSKQVGQTYSGTMYFDNLRISYPKEIITSIKGSSNLPDDFYLAQNYPNPFNPSTRINFSLEQNSLVTLKIFDVLGREVKTLVKNNLGKGNHSVVWDASNFPSGVYIYNLQANGKTLSRKMILLK